MFIIRIIHSAIAYLLVALVCIVFGIPTAIILLLPERIRYNSKLYFWLTYQFFYWTLKATLLPIKYTGLYNIPHNTPVIFAANHQSGLDVPLLGLLARQHPHVWLALSYLAGYPVLGFVLRRIAVLVDTSSPARASRTLVQAINRIKDNHHHVMIFPEGGRFTDGHVHDFFSGFVILARRTGRPVVPVCIQGVQKVYPPDAWLLVWHSIKVVVGQPYFIREDESDDAFKQRVHQWFVDQEQ